MKKLLVLTLALVMTFAFGYVTLASTMGIGTTEGAVSVEVGTYVDPSDYTDEVDVTVYYGLNDQTLLYLGYGTDSEDIKLNVRYAFSENLAATLKYVLAGQEGDDDTITAGLRYKTNVSDSLALVGALQYTNYDPDAEIDVIGQVEYSFTKKVVGTLQYVYSEVGDLDGSMITVGIETYPTDALCVYLDYEMPEDAEDDYAYLAVSYSF